MDYSKQSNLIQLLLNTVQSSGQNPALLFEERKISYQELWESVKQFANALYASGIQPGERIALLLPNVPEYVTTYYGALLNGNIVVPINITFKEQEIQYILEDSECAIVIVWHEIAPEIAKIVNREENYIKTVAIGTDAFPDFISWNDFMNQTVSQFEAFQPQPDDTAVILYTSGTTAHPRGVMLSHSNLTMNALACLEAGVVNYQDVFLGVLPFYHSFGQTVVMNTCIASGALNILMPRFEPDDVIETIKNYEVTIFAAVPTMFNLLVDRQKEELDFPSMRLCLSGGAKLDIQVYHEFYERFNQPIYEGYGLTEASPVVSFNPMDYRSKVGSVGLPVSGVEIKIVDHEGNELTPGNVGEVVVKGNNVMQGYLNRPEATKKMLKDGSLFTGDVGKLDDDGYLYIFDRKSDLIIKGGFNVYPKEIEQIISYHPKVQEVAVIGVPDRVQGEEVKAYISLKSKKRVSKKEIIEYCKEHMAIYKCPKYITFLRAIPKNSSGKILKRKLFIRKPK